MFGLAVVLAVSSLAPAQGDNVVLLGQLGGYAFYNDVWGYAHPDGREYAVVGTNTGTTIINTTNPAAPFEVAFVNGPNSIWRDMCTFGSYVYIVTEGGGGMQIIDMSSPDSPQNLGTWGQGLWGNAHNISADEGTGWLYVVGTNNGTITLDASSNPTNPSVIGTTPGPYLHDITVANGLAHCSALNNGEYEIWDVTSFPFTVLSESPTPGDFTHNSVANLAQTVAATTDEIPGGVVQLFDISNPNAPVAAGSYTANPIAVPHNAFIVGDRCHISFYTEGYRVLDISDINNPVEIGSYDTFPGSSSNFDGAWGCYPFQPSGNVYVSDIQSGLFIVRPSTLDIAHTPLTTTMDEVGPYVVTAGVTSDDPISSVTLTWSVDGGPNTNVPMTPTGTPNEFSATIPGQAAPAQVAYSITAVDSAGSSTAPASGEHGFVVGVLTSIYFDDFEAGEGGWTHGLIQQQDDWQFGSPNGASGSSQGQPWSDPSSAYSGSNCWGNDLAIQGFNGAYQPNVSNWLQSPPIPTGGQQGLQLRLRRWLTVEENQYDQAKILINGQVVWENPNFNLVDNQWELLQVDISSVSDFASSIDIRFTLESDGGLQLGGWNIDDVEVLAVSDCFPTEYYGVATPGSGGNEPTITTFGVPRLGSNDFGLTTTNALGGSSAFLALGFAPAQVDALGLTLLVNPIATTLTTTTNGAAGIAGVGSATLTFPIPDIPGADDLNLYFQWFIADPNSPSGLVSASRGARARTCQF